MLKNKQIKLKRIDPSGYATEIIFDISHIYFQTEGQFFSSVAFTPGKRFLLP